jgi:predicted DNA-binding protein with PD1-like motif
MKYTFDGFNYIVRLDRGDRLSEAFQSFVEATSIKGAWVSGIGGCEEVTLGFYDLKQKVYRWKEFEGPREIASLTGSLAYDDAGEFAMHLHGVFGDEAYHSVSGHVRDLVAAATVELFVHATEQSLRRKLNPNVGLKMLVL